MRHEAAATAKARSKVRRRAACVQVLQDDVVRYANQPIARGGGRDARERAWKALIWSQVRYAAGTASRRSREPVIGSYTPQKAGGGGDPSVSHRGDMQAGMSQADTRIEHVYWTPFEVHNPMEPHATIAVWDAPDHLTLYDATQGVFTDRGRVASVASACSRRTCA